MRLTLRPTVLLALGALTVGSISLVSAAAVPAAADETVVLEQDFEGGEAAGLSPLWDSGNPAFAWVADPDDATNTVLHLSERGENWQSVSTPAHVGADETSFLTPGVEYELSLRVRLANADDAAQQVRLTNNSDYQQLAGSSSSGQVSASEWTSLVGTYIPSDQNVTLYPEAPANIDILIDDVVVTDLGTADNGGPGVCVPQTVEHTLIDFENETTGTWSANDAVSLQVIDGTDSSNTTKVLDIADRADLHYGLQSPEGAYDAGVEYTFSADVLLPEDATVRFVAFDNDSEDTYNWMSGNSVNAGEWTTVSGTYTFQPGAIATAKAYIQVHNTQGYQLDNVTVTHQSVCGDGPAPGSVALSTDFEDGLDGWGPRHSEAGDHVVEITTTQAHSGDQSALLTERTSQGSGLGIDVTELMEPGAQYEVSAWIKFADGEETDNVVLSMERITDGTSTFGNLVTADNMSNSEWVEMTGTFSSGSWESARLYFETEWEAEGVIANTSDFMVDDIVISVPEAAVVQDLTPLKDTLDMPVGVAIDSREITGAPAELTLRHFNQITAENHMKVESWYDADRQFQRHSEATELLDFAVDNNLGLFGHVLVWHSQTPDWFFQHDDGSWLTDSEADKQELRDRLRTHIFNVAQSIADDYGPYGSAGNPIVGWDVVNEVVSDQATADGLRQSPLYQVLGEEYIHLAFEFADEAFNDVYAASGSDRPVLLYINDYNTEQQLKGDQYEALVLRMVNEGTPLDGVGHQFHLSVNASVSAMRATLDRFAGLGLHQAVTEFDVTINPANEANRVRQGHFYRDAFDMFRDYHATAPAAEKFSSITIWGLTDNRSWRGEQQPLMFDGQLQAKPAYYGAVGDLGNLPGLITTANVFAGDVPLTSGFEEAKEWRNLPEQPLTGGAGGFQIRWNDDHLTVLVRSTVDAERLEISYAGSEFVYGSQVADSIAGLTSSVGGEFYSVVHVPHAGVSQGDNADFDLRVVTSSGVAGAWNSAGDVGQLTFLEPLSTLETPQLAAPAVDGVVDDVWAGIPSVTTGNTVEGNSAGAYADVRTLWEGNTLYVLYEVTDPVIDSSNSDPWNKDGIELFLDLGNTKAGTYGANDTQIRVTIEEELSFGTGNTGLQQSRVADYAVEMTPAGYNVELAIDLIGQSGGQSDVPLGGEGVFHGIDFQVNDGRDGARYSVHTWAEPTGTGYQNTDRWGVTQQVDALSDNGDDGTAPGDGDSGSTPGDGDDAEGPGDGPGTGVTPPLTADEVKEHDKGGIEVPGSARAGDTITIRVGTAHSGVATQAFLYSEPQLIGQSIVDADGNIRATIPADTTPGTHTIAVYDADGNLLGWDTIEILAADGSLPVTGADGFLLPLSIGLLLMLAGVTMVVRRQLAQKER